MAVLQLKNADGYLYFDEENCRQEGRARAAAYQSAHPFPHIVIDDFLDKDMLRGIHAQYPSTENQRFFDRDQERFKFQFGPGADLSGRTRNILAELNSQAFLGFLEEMTGIKGLISDPYFNGGGLHLTRRGGHLGVHADFNVHGDMQVERRLNLLVYLNEDWDDAYNGKLELWDTEMKGCEVSVAPLLGRAVVFSTTLDSYHGHPDPLACPPERDRRSIATYYYTAFPDGVNSVPQRTTVFQARPGSSDRTDWRVKVDHLIGDWVPPRLQKYARKLNRFA
ncbi:2OG-Fe(II) oxygenase [Sphingomonas jejuensis]|nr:2OG-Fe(II) oxygenase [Sphingomonas jejuensis]